MIRLSIAAVAAFAVDQLSKLWIVFGLDLQSRLAIDVLPPFLNLRMGWNTGINFGLFSGNTDIMRWVLIALAIVICAWLTHWARSQTRAIIHISAGLIVGGALANALDRLVYGAVADFLNMSCCGIDNRFTFNIADVFIFAGAFGLVIFADDKKAA